MGKNYDYVKVPREILESMGKIVEYCWNNERKHFEEHFNVEMIEDDKFVNSESGEEFDISKTDHIFKHIKIVNDYLTELSDEEEFNKIINRETKKIYPISQPERMRAIIEIIREKSDVEDIIKEADKQGISRERTEEALQRLKRYGQIWQPMHEKYRVTE